MKIKNNSAVNIAGGYLSSIFAPVFSVPIALGAIDILQSLGASMTPYSYLFCGALSFIISSNLASALGSGGQTASFQYRSSAAFPKPDGKPSKS